MAMGMGWAMGGSCWQIPYYYGPVLIQEYLSHEFHKK